MYPNARYEKGHKNKKGTSVAIEEAYFNSMYFLIRNKQNEMTQLFIESILHIPTITIALNKSFTKLSEKLICAIQSKCKFSPLVFYSIL